MNDDLHSKWTLAAIILAAAALNFLKVDVQTIMICAALTWFFSTYWNPGMTTGASTYTKWGLIRHPILPLAKLAEKRGILKNPVIGPAVLTVYFILFAALLNWLFMALWIPVITPVIDRAQEMHSQIMAMTMTKETMGICIMLVACLWFSSWIWYAAEYVNREER